MIEAILFDVDGTLLQTQERQFSWFKHWAKINNKHIPYKTLSSFMEFYNEECHKEGGVQNVYNSLGLPCDMDNSGHPVWEAYIKYSSENPAKLYPGIKDMMTELRDITKLSEKSHQRVRFGINTTNKWKTIYPSFVKEDILDCFDFRVTRETLDDYHGNGGADLLCKPSKVSVALSLIFANSKGDFTIHVGDTRNDLTASQDVIKFNPLHRETLQTIGVSWGYEGRELLEQGAEIPNRGKIYFNRIIDKPSQLVEIVKDYLKE